MYCLRRERVLTFKLRFEPEYRKWCRPSMYTFCGKLDHDLVGWRKRKERTKLMESVKQVCSSGLIKCRTTATRRARPSQEGHTI